jgi:hypothetical protein
MYNLKIKKYVHIFPKIKVNGFLAKCQIITIVGLKNALHRLVHVHNAVAKSHFTLKRFQIDKIGT